MLSGDMTPEEFKQFQDNLREAIGNTYTVEVGKILTQEEAENLIRYIRVVHNDPDATIQIIQPLEYEKPNFDFEIVAKNNQVISQRENLDSLSLDSQIEEESLASKESVELNELYISEYPTNENDKISKIYGENWIVLQNRLLNAISDLNQDERRFVIFLSPLVRKAVDINPHQRNFTVVAKDFAKEYDIAEKHVYEKLKKISKSIHGKVFYYWNFRANKKANLKGVSWIGTAEYKDREGMVEVSLLDEVIQMLTVFDKSNPFTKYERNHIANLGSHGIILFELISSCMHQLFKSKSYEIEYLREKFNCRDTYLPIAEFKRNVIDKAIKDIESNTPLKINYEQKKTGKKVTELLFSFYDSSIKKEQLEENILAKNDVITTEDKKLFGWQTKGLTDAQIKKIAVYQKEFIDANTSKVSPNDRRDYPEIFEDWKAMLKDPKQVITFHKIQELLDRKKS